MYGIQIPNEFSKQELKPIPTVNQNKSFSNEGQLGSLVPIEEELIYSSYTESSYTYFAKFWIC